MAYYYLELRKFCRDNMLIYHHCCFSRILLVACRLVRLMLTYFCKNAKIDKIYMTKSIGGKRI